MFENLRDSADTWNLLDTHDTPAQVSARLVELAKASEEKATLVLRLQGEAEERESRSHGLNTRPMRKRNRSPNSKPKPKKDQSLRLNFERENEQRSQDLERLESQLEASNERLARVKDELLDSRWEALTLRGSLLGKADSNETPHSRILELETRVETITSERDHLRAMLASLQSDLEQERTVGADKTGRAPRRPGSVGRGPGSVEDHGERS